MSAEYIRVERAAKKVAAAQQQLEAAIQDAYPTESLRRVAKAAGLTHETVRKITLKAPNCR